MPRIVRATLGGGFGTRSVGAITASLIINSDGLDALAGGAGERAVEVGLEKLALDTAFDAQKNIRAVGAVRTGYMLTTTEAHKRSALVWTIGTAAPYGFYVEHGTSRMAARPWLTPAMEHAKREFDDILGRALQQAAQR